MSSKLSDLVSRLRDCEEVTGLVRYGGRRAGDDSEGGDFDLFAFLEEKDPNLESIHFYWGETPVDLSLRTVADLERKEPLSFIDADLAEGEILYDRDGGLEDLLASRTGKWKQESDNLPESEKSACRFFQTHVMNKVAGRLEKDPVFCNLLLSVNMCWLMHIYFKVRQMKFGGEKNALNWLREHDPDAASMVHQFFGATSLIDRLKHATDLTDLVLEPIGGRWLEGEVLGTGVDQDSTNLQERAEALFSRLLGTDSGEIGIQ